MSKRAEDAGLRAYPRAPFGPQNITDDDCNRQVYIRGYEQAEKDLALTPRDVATIYAHLEDVLEEARQGFHEEWSAMDMFEETLKRFNEQRKI